MTATSHFIILVSLLTSSWAWFQDRKRTTPKGRSRASLQQSASRCATHGSDDVSERRLSEDARSGLTRKETKNAALFLPKKLFCKETLGNACIKWLPMLY